MLAGLAVRELGYRARTLDAGSNITRSKKAVDKVKIEIGNPEVPGLWRALGLVVPPYRNGETLNMQLTTAAIATDWAHPRRCLKSAATL